MVVAADPVAACAGARPQVWKKRAEQQRQTVRGALLPREPSREKLGSWRTWPTGAYTASNNGRYIATGWRHWAVRDRWRHWGESRGPNVPRRLGL